MVRYWNKLAIAQKKSPNAKTPHPVASISIPYHLIEDTNWENGDPIYIQKYELNRDGKKRFSFELINLNKEPEGYAELTFLEMQRKDYEFMSRILPKNMNNLSPKLQELVKKTILEPEIDKRNKEKSKKAKEAEKKLISLGKKALETEIANLKKRKNQSIKQIEKSFDREIKEKENQYKKYYAK